MFNTGLLLVDALCFNYVAHRSLLVGVLHYNRFEYTFSTYWMLYIVIILNTGLLLIGVFYTIIMQNTGECSTLYAEYTQVYYWLEFYAIC